MYSAGDWMGCRLPRVRCRRFRTHDTPLGSSNTEIDRQAAMNTLADRQEGRAVGMVRFGAARTLDDCRHGNDNAEQKDP